MQERNIKRKARDPVQARGIQTRTRILEAAEALFSSKGYHDTSSKQIARKAGVAIGSFYSYFDDKKAVFLEILRKHSSQIFQNIQAIQKDDGIMEKTPREVIDLVIKIALASHEVSPLFHREANKMRYSDPDVVLIQEEVEEMTAKILVSFFGLYGDKIRIKDYEAGARIICLCVEETAHHIKLFNPKITEDRLVKELGDMLYCYIFSA